jgi:hypothetical protein
MARGGRPPAESYPQTKISLWVGADDWRWLTARHRFHASTKVRQLIGDYRRKIEGPRRLGYRDEIEARAWDLRELLAPPKAGRG